ncbi:hypoxanthine phosphoribosyltransferase [Paenibacillus sp. FSL R7-0273]|uniref:hypoxanthine phosphoribosyltransferase n=1 Tax=Paenibacillus sp. FSL R7-0273 TaxID=1536772 RepID=UPI0004F7F5A3|nr:hypoxanthine phosphoribosyltransferase [Paenibacillus sp. FSL R7-0273]AIQ48989.1 hypoxanthine phosphoribosyltransferase [Paenibacillus sp. FSL R7-0273]OMF90543.1 hypoxanthine phosphoribosyltransferase [Paenibacillus sp. FSL R7-0273]
MNELRKVLVSKAELESKVRELGAVISRDYEGKELVLIGILKGAAVFMSDLMREITFPVAVDYMSVSSYGSSATTSGVITIKQDIDTDIRGKHVLLVEDLIDTGLTLQHLKQLFALREAASVRICTILSKPSRRVADIPIDYSGIDIPDEFVVGYGLDYAEQYRNLPEVWIVETDAAH